MSAATVARSYSFTVRLSPEEKAVLEALAKRFDLDKSATVREALSWASENNGPSLPNKTLPRRGQFIPLNGRKMIIPVCLRQQHQD